MKSFYAIITLIVLSGCTSYKINNFDKFRTTTLLKVDKQLSSQDLEVKPTKLVIMPIEVVDSSISKDLGVDKEALNHIIKITNQFRGIQVIDRKIGDKILDELKIREYKGEEMQKSLISVADEAMIIYIDSVSFASKTSQNLVANILATTAVTAYNVSNADSRDSRIQSVTVDPTHEYKATVRGRIVILDLKTGNEILNKTIEGIVKDDESASGAQKAQTMNTDLVSRALEKAIYQSLNPFLHEHVNLNTFVFERKDDKKNTILKINRGLVHKIKTGDRVYIKTVEKTINPITAEESTEEKESLLGHVSDRITTKDAWIVIDAKAKNLLNDIKIGSELHIKLVLNKLEKFLGIYRS